MRVAWAVLCLLCGLAGEASSSELTTIPVPAGPETAPPGIAADEEPVRLEVMTVTAQRREESIQEVPTMVAAFGAEELRLRGVNDPTSLQFLVPGMVYTSIGKYSFPYIRGIGSNSILPSVDSPVATLLDGVYSATTLIAFKNFADVERVEVLKGPQGTLFGRNSNAGVISVTTREPGDHLEAQAALTLGSQERLGGSVYVAGPLGKLASVGVAGYMERYGPYYENINPDGPTPVDSRNWGLRVKARVPLGEHWSLLAHAYAAEEDGADTAIWENIRPSLDTLALGAQTIDQPRRTNVNREGRSTPRHFGGDLRLNWELPDLELWSLTAYQQTGYSGGVDLDGSNADYAAVYLRDGHANRAWSQELQVASVGEERMDWLAGVYYFDSFGGWDPIFMELGPQTTLGTLLLQPLREALRRAGLDPSSLPADAPPATRVQVRGIIDNHAYAAFGELGWRLTEHWKLIAGLRYSYEERVLVRGSSEIQVLGSIPSTPVSIADFRNMPADWDDWSPKLSLQWRDDAWLAWLTYAEGFKSGTWNAFPLLDPVSLVQPEQIDSWEIGFKSDLWNRRLRLNAAAYHYDYRNLQVFVTSIKSNGTVKIENAGRARVQGVEAELQLRPTAPWLWTLGAAYLDGKYREFIGTGYNQLGEPYQGNFAGNRMSYAPELTATTELAYTLPLRRSALTAAVNYYHSSRFYFDAQNDLPQERYGVWGGRLSWVSASGDLTLSLIGNNLTEENFERMGIVFDFGQIVSDAPGRQFALRLDWKFGS